jgi:hypothetical protein
VTNLLLSLIWTCSPNGSNEVVMASPVAGPGWRQDARMVAVGQRCGTNGYAQVHLEDMPITTGTVWFGVVAMVGEGTNTIESVPSNLLPATWVQVSSQVSTNPAGPFTDTKTWSELVATNRFWRIRTERQ